MNNTHSYLVSVARHGRGLVAMRTVTAEPAQALELYDFEACPFCRKVREVLSELDLDYIQRSCPKGDLVKRPFVASRSKAQFPFLVDPNTSREFTDSEAIITYLLDTYGNGRHPLGRMMAPLNSFSSGAASLLRMRGMRVRPGSEQRVQPAKMLELWNFEASPYCRKVRETLCELNLDYRVHNVAKRGRRRGDLVALGGKMQVPYLADPNTDTALYESDEINAYLERTYG